MEENRIYRCVVCGVEFQVFEDANAFRCPDCGNKTLILLKGTTRRKKGGCAPSG